MPTRNIVKEYEQDSYYHLYTRGVNKLPIFESERDYIVFLSLFKRYLSPEPSRSNQRVLYRNYHENLRLISYALMPNHIHLFVYQHDLRTIQEFMRSLLTSYSMYFNKTHNRCGPLFQSRYLGSRITDDAHFQHISRYIHLNPHDWRTPHYTSLPYFLGKKSASWIHPEQVSDTTPEKYLQFLEEYDEGDELGLSMLLANDQEPN